MHSDKSGGTAQSHPPRSIPAGHDNQPLSTQCPNFWIGVKSPEQLEESAGIVTHEPGVADPTVCTVQAGSQAFG